MPISNPSYTPIADGTTIDAADVNVPFQAIYDTANELVNQVNTTTADMVTAQADIVTAQGEVDALEIVVAGLTTPLMPYFKHGIYLHNRTSYEDTHVEIMANALMLQAWTGDAWDTQLTAVSLLGASAPNITTAGAGGLDAGGGALAANTWYALYVIYDSTGSLTAGMFSTNFVKPVTMPGTYDKYRRVGFVRTDGTNAILKFNHTPGESWFYFSEFAGSVDMDTMVMPSDIAVTFNNTYVPVTSQQCKIWLFSDDLENTNTAGGAIYFKANDLHGSAYGEAAPTFTISEVNEAHFLSEIMLSWPGSSGATTVTMYTSSSEQANLLGTIHIRPYAWYDNA